MRALCSSTKYDFHCSYIWFSLSANSINNNSHAPFSAAFCSDRHSSPFFLSQDRPHQFWWKWPLEEFLPGGSTKLNVNHLHQTLHQTDHRQWFYEIPSTTVWKRKEYTHGDFCSYPDHWLHLWCPELSPQLYYSSEILCLHQWQKPERALCRW